MTVVLCTDLRTQRAPSYHSNNLRVCYRVFYAGMSFILHQPKSIKTLNVKKCSINIKAKLLCSVKYGSSKQLYFFKTLLNKENLKVPRCFKLGFSLVSPDMQWIFSNSSSHCQEHTVDLYYILLCLLFESGKPKEHMVYWWRRSPVRSPQVYFNSVHRCSMRTPRCSHVHIWNSANTSASQFTIMHCCLKLD